LATGLDDAHHEDVTETGGHPKPGEVSNTMKMIDRALQRRRINRQNRAIDRAWMSAPSQTMRDEIRFLAQRQPF
jgi:hypothetical protein